VLAPEPESARQASFDDLGTPLSEVTFVVVDLETTGGSPSECAITEIGAVKYRAGECLGEFQTLVNPGMPIPPMITFLTGITEAMVTPAPRIEEVLPAFLEFLGRADAATVLGGHNVRFDVSFLDTALVANGYARLPHRRVDTIGLARRLVRDEVPNLRLATLARHFRTQSDPIHRALADARATLEVLHALLERAGTLGVLGLDDLLALPTIRMHPSVGKLRLTSRLPRRPGVYLFRDRGGRVLYAGKATNLRTRVRSYFSSEDRRKVPQLLREMESIDYRVCDHALEAEVREIRLIQRHEPRFNRQAKAWRRYAYLELTLHERFPRLAVVREAKRPAARYLGPFRSRSGALAVAEAIESAVPLRRCTRRIGRQAPIGCEAPCVPAQLGVAACPCSGATGRDEYAAIVQRVVRALDDAPHELLGPLETRMHDLATVERFEEAALTRDRLRVLARALERQQLVNSVRAVGALRLPIDGGELVIAGGRLVLDDHDAEVASGLDLTLPPRRDEIDELLVVSRWVVRHVRTLSLDSQPAAFVAPEAFPAYEPAKAARPYR